MSESELRNWRKFLRTGHTPATHSSPTEGESSAMLLAWREAATQRGAMAAKSLISLSKIAMRWRLVTATQASLCSCNTCTAASTVSCVEGGMLPETAGNCGEPWYVVMDMVVRTSIG